MVQGEERERRKQSQQTKRPAGGRDGARRRGRTPWALADWRQMEKEIRERTHATGGEGSLQKEGLVAHVLPCRTHVYLRSIYPPPGRSADTIPSPSTKRNGARATTSAVQTGSIHLSLTRSTPPVYTIESCHAYTCTYRVQDCSRSSGLPCVHLYVSSGNSNKSQVMALRFYIVGPGPDAHGDDAWIWPYGIRGKIDEPGHMYADKTGSAVT
jgi:hypothetical protein